MRHRDLVRKTGPSIEGLAATWAEQMRVEQPVPLPDAPAPKRRRALPIVDDFDVTGIQRPKTRADCAEGERPCPWVSCRHNLYLDVDRLGMLRVNFPGEVWEMSESCALDLAARDGMTLDDVAQLYGVTRERIRQIEARALYEVAKRDRLTHRELAAEAAEAGLVPVWSRRNQKLRAAHARPAPDLDEEEEDPDGDDEGDEAGHAAA